MGGGGNRYLERKMRSSRDAEQVKRSNTPVPYQKIDIHACTRNNKECRDRFCYSYVVASRLYDSAKISLISNFWTFAQAIITDIV